MIAKETSVLLKIFAMTFFSGFLLANAVLICASFIPLFIYFVAFFIAPPEVHLKKVGLPGSVRLGETIEVGVTGKITGGRGAVVICDEVPDSFQLAEGSNYKVIWKESKEKLFDFSYKIRCTKCGSYQVGTGWETRHSLGLVLAKSSCLSPNESAQLRVFPPQPKVRGMKSPMRTTKKIHPHESFAKIGPLSTEFKEIRDYCYGDPFKIINWKASARAAGGRELYPLVNEYQREGRLSVWLFMNADPTLKIGTSLENVVEHSVRAAYTVSHYLLNRGYRLGMYVYNHRGEIVHSDAGKKQFIKIADCLLKLTPSRGGLEVFWDEGFSSAVERNRKQVIAQSPWIVVITHVTSHNYRDLLGGVRKVLVYKRRRKQPDITVINVLPYDLFPRDNPMEHVAARMLDVTSRSFSSRLRNAGATVLDWNPKDKSIEDVLLTTVRAR